MKFLVLLLLTALAVKANVIRRYHPHCNAEELFLQPRLGGDYDVIEVAAIPNHHPWLQPVQTENDDYIYQHGAVFYMDQIPRGIEIATGDSPKIRDAVDTERSELTEETRFIASPELNEGRFICSSCSRPFCSCGACSICNQPSRCNQCNAFKCGCQGESCRCAPITVCSVCNKPNRCSQCNARKSCDCCKVVANPCGCDDAPQIKDVEQLEVSEITEEAKGMKDEELCQKEFAPSDKACEMKVVEISTEIEDKTNKEQEKINTEVGDKISGVEDKISVVDVKIAGVEDKLAEVEDKILQVENKIIPEVKNNKLELEEESEAKTETTMVETPETTPCETTVPDVTVVIENRSDMEEIQEAPKNGKVVSTKGGSSSSSSLL